MEFHIFHGKIKTSSNILYRMVKSRKIHVVDLNEIKSVDNNAATHTETVEPAEETAESPLVPEPVVEVEPPHVQDEPTDVKPIKKCDEKKQLRFLQLGYVSESPEIQP